MNGDSLQVGVCGLGNSPQEAMNVFDDAFKTSMPEELQP